MSQDIHSQIDSLEGQNVDYTDPSLYAKILGYDQEHSASAGAGAAGAAASAGLGDTAAAAATSQGDGSTASGQSDNTASATAAATADSGAAPNTADQSSATQSQAIDGIATKDGKRTIPYAVLEQERRANAQLKEQLRIAQQQLQEKAAASSNSAGDLADRAATDPDSLTDAELEQLEQDFPALAKPLKILRRLVDEKGGAQPATQAAAATPAAAPAAPPAGKATTQEDEQAAYDTGIADNPLIAKWMSQGGREWQRACAIDQVLMADPANANLTYTERFAKVQAMVAAEFGIPLPAAPAPAPAPAAGAAAPAATPAAPPSQTVMPTLTDLSGTGVSVSKDPMGGMTPGQMVDAAMEMTEEQLRRMAGLSY